MTSRLLQLRLQPGRDLTEFPDRHIVWVGRSDSIAPAK